MSGGVYLSEYILVVSCGYTTHRDVVAAQVLKEKGLSTVGHTGKNAHTEMGRKLILILSSLWEVRVRGR
ncbi:MAG: hypothetical protein O4805_06295 [Trichodesmium sp. St16_bin2-tuft]|jgi:transposase|nr:hypothetical protein [Trichodesmium sp. MAG_R02]MDE5086773.1 hypothetical protein [Trichodesmium sp. St16_bin2-tuft]